MNEPMHRYKYTKLTKDQIEKKLARTASGPTSASPLSDALAGKSFKIVTDNGPVLKYSFLYGVGPRYHVSNTGDSLILHAENRP
jgi:hypothetical protein